MATSTQLTEEIPERTTPVFAATFQDQDGNAISSSAFDAATLTLYDESSGDVINSREDLDVLSLISASGVLTWNPTQADMAIVNTANGREAHIILLEWQWDTTNYGKHQIRHIVRNFDKVP
jgi:WD40 repeat protein